MLIAQAIYRLTGAGVPSNQHISLKFAETDGNSLHRACLIRMNDAKHWSVNRQTKV